MLSKWRRYSKIARGPIAGNAIPAGIYLRPFLDILRQKFVADASDTVDVTVSVHDLLGFQLGRSQPIKQWVYASWLSEIVVHDIDEVPVIQDVSNEMTSLTAFVVAFAPLEAKVVELVSPGQERYGLDYRWLHDFFAREDAPGDGVRSTIGICVGLQFASVVDSIVGNVWILLHSFHHFTD